MADHDLFSLPKIDVWQAICLEEVISLASERQNVTKQRFLTIKTLTLFQTLTLT
jgi:hypothetical protein